MVVNPRCSILRTSSVDKGCINSVVGGIVYIEAVCMYRVLLSCIA